MPSQVPPVAAAAVPGDPVVANLNPCVLVDGVKIIVNELDDHMLTLSHIFLGLISSTFVSDLYVLI